MHSRQGRRGVPHSIVLAKKWTNLCSGSRSLKSVVIQRGKFWTLRTSTRTIFKMTKRRIEMMKSWDKDIPTISVSDSGPCMASKKTNLDGLEAHRSVRCHMQRIHTDHPKVASTETCKHQTAWKNHYICPVNQIRRSPWQKDKWKGKHPMSYRISWTRIATFDPTRNLQNRKANKSWTVKQVHRITN